jgi:PAS domain S-box-containing protein
MAARRQRTRRLLLTGLAAALVCRLPAQAAAPDDSGPRPTRLRLRYGGDRDFAPFESLDAQGRPVGFQIDLIKALARVGGMTLSIELLDWPAVEAGLRAGRFDALAMVDTPARRAWALFARSHASPALAVYQRADLPLPQSLQALAGLRVALPDSEAMQATHASLLAGIDAVWITLPSRLDALQAVAAGQADAALLPRAYGDRLLAAGAAPGLLAAPLNLNLQAYAFAVAPGNRVLQQRIDAGLAELEATGRLEALRRQWLGSPRELAARAQGPTLYPRDRLSVAVVAAGALAGLGGLGWLGWQLRRRQRRLRSESARRVVAEQALADTQDRLVHVFALHPDAMLVAELGSGLLLDVNAALCSLLGLDRTALLGSRLDSLPAIAGSANLPALRALLDRDGEFDAVPLRVQHADGSSRACLVSAELIAVHGSTQVLAVLRDVTEPLRRSEALQTGFDTLAGQLDDVKLQLRAARQQRTQDQATVSSHAAELAHHLKAPLHALRGFTGLLRNDLVAGHWTQAHQNADQIGQAARRMEAQVDALSDLAGIDALPCSPTALDMTALARQAWAALPAGQAQPLPVCTVDDALPTARADAALVARLWSALLGNARKFSARTTAPQVRVDAFVEQGRSWYRISDNGVGFDVARASRLFMPFQRSHSAREFPGLGIGLSLAQRIVQRHGGDIRLRSQPGAGTVAEFTLQAPAAA